MALRPSLTASLVILALFTSCGEGPPPAPESRGGAATDGDHAHGHSAPHGGALVALGDHFAHLELVFDAASGRITVYVLDGAARDGVRLAQDELRARIEVDHGELPLVLEPVERALTGETRGDSSEFSGRAEGLAGATRFDLTIETIRVRGQDFAEVRIPYPDGDH
jgi:hypothetical protein